MGILSDAPPPAEINPPKEDEVPDTGYPTNVDGVNSDSVIKHGNLEIPCFNVDNKSFYQNMQDGRRRIRFKTGSSAQQYMAKTKYSTPFYISTEINGKTYQRKIK